MLPLKVAQIERDPADVSHAFHLAHRQHRHKCVRSKPDFRIRPVSLLVHEEAVSVADGRVEAGVLSASVGGGRDELVVGRCGRGEAVPEGRVRRAGQGEE